MYKEQSISFYPRQPALAGPPVSVTETELRGNKMYKEQSNSFYPRQPALAGPPISVAETELPTKANQPAAERENNLSRNLRP